MPFLGQKIIKRDGRKVNFDRQKIFNAIYKALEDSRQYISELKNINADNSSNCESCDIKTCDAKTDKSCVCGTSGNICENKNLSVDDINQIVFNSGIVGNTIEIKRRKYIKMVLLNELIRCSIVKYGPNGFWQVQSYIDEGKKSYITYSVDKARIITETLSPQEIKKLLSDLNVNNISEYMQYYYSNTKKR